MNMHVCIYIYMITPPHDIPATSSNIILCESPPKKYLETLGIYIYINDIDINLHM